MSKGYKIVVSVLLLISATLITYFLLGYYIIGANKSKGECDRINFERNKFALSYLEKVSFDNEAVRNVSHLEELARFVSENKETIKIYQKGYVKKRSNSACKDDEYFFPTPLRKQAKLILNRCAINNLLIYLEDKRIRFRLNGCGKQLYYSTVYHDICVYTSEVKNQETGLFCKYFTFNKNTYYEIHIAFNYIDGCNE